jgi:hypothetical protein
MKKVSSAIDSIRAMDEREQKHGVKISREEYQTLLLHLLEDIKNLPGDSNFEQKLNELIDNE